MSIKNWICRVWGWSVPNPPVAPEPEPKPEPVWVKRHSEWFKTKICHCGKRFDPIEVSTSIRYSPWNGICPECGCEDKPTEKKGRLEWEQAANAYLSGYVYAPKRNEVFVEWTECSKPKP